MALSNARQSRSRVGQVASSRIPATSLVAKYPSYRRAKQLNVMLAYATFMTVWCWQAPDHVRRSDGSRPVRLGLARRAHLPVSALGVGRLKGRRELTAALPHASGVATFRNVMGGFMQIPD